MVFYIGNYMNKTFSALYASAVPQLFSTFATKKHREMFRLVHVLVLSLFGVAVSMQLNAATTGAIHGSNGMVASRSMIASRAGVEVMKAGGNAIDGAVATAFALAVTHPSAGNLGGGGLMVIRLANGNIVTNDHREKAPAAAHRDMYLDAQGDVVKGLSTDTHLATGVPGSVAGLLDVLDAHGDLEREKVLAPAIALARDGFPLSFDLAAAFKRRLEAFSKHPATFKKFTRDNGTPLQEGDVWKQPDLAKTLVRIAEQGRDGFYKGKTADLLVAEMKANNGIITHQDLVDYQSVWREPVHGTYRGHDIYGMAPPSSGGVLVVQMLNMLEPYDIGAAGFGSASNVHKMIEAERRAYADRARHLGDPDYYEVPMAMLASKDYAKKRFADFNPARANRSTEIDPGNFDKESMETTHLSSMDIAGNMVAYTTTLNLSYGIKMIATGTGFLLNNEMDDFSSKPNTPNSFGLIGGEANAIQPGKRMLSSMSPTIVTKDGKPLLVTGSPGGSTIITTVFQVIVNVIDHAMNVADAVAAPRFHHQWQPDRVIYENRGLSPDTVRILQDKGHQQMSAWVFGGGIGDANSIMYVGEELQGKSDPRNDGGAAGF